MNTKATESTEDSFDKRFQMRVNEEFFDKLDRLCRAETGRVPTPSEMVRRLVDRAIERLGRRK
jgi:hypothetical protein